MFVYIGMKLNEEITSYREFSEGIYEYEGDISLFTDVIDYLSNFRYMRIVFDGHLDPIFALYITDYLFGSSLLTSKAFTNVIFGKSYCPYNHLVYDGSWTSVPALIPYSLWENIPSRIFIGNLYKNYFIGYTSKSFQPLLGILENGADEKEEPYLINGLLEHTRRSLSSNVFTDMISAPKVNKVFVSSSIGKLTNDHFSIYIEEKSNDFTDKINKRKNWVKRMIETFLHWMILKSSDDIILVTLWDLLVVNWGNNRIYFPYHNIDSYSSMLLKPLIQDSFHIRYSIKGNSDIMFFYGISATIACMKYFEFYDPVLLSRVSVSNGHIVVPILFGEWYIRMINALDELILCNFRQIYRGNSLKTAIKYVRQMKGYGVELSSGSYLVLVAETPNNEVMICEKKDDLSFETDIGRYEFKGYEGRSSNFGNYINKFRLTKLYNLLGWNLAFFEFQVRGKIKFKSGIYVVCIGNKEYKLIKTYEGCHDASLCVLQILWKSGMFLQPIEKWYYLRCKKLVYSEKMRITNHVDSYVRSLMGLNSG